jgi:hypothetical protein
MIIHVGKTMKALLTTAVFWLIYVLFGYEFATVTALSLIAALMMKEGRFIL